MNNLLTLFTNEQILYFDDRGLQIQMAIAGGAALRALLVATTLAVYKPGGVTRTVGVNNMKSVRRHRKDHQFEQYSARQSTPVYDKK